MPVNDHTALTRLSDWRKRHKRFVDLLAYIAISLLFVITVVIAALKGISFNAIGKPFLFLIFTAFVFTRFIQPSRRFWKHAAFWWLTVVLFLLHCGVWVAFLRRMESLPKGLFLIMIVTALLLFELKLFQFVRDSMLHRKNDHYLPE